MAVEQPSSARAQSSALPRSPWTHCRSGNAARARAALRVRQRTCQPVPSNRGARARPTNPVAPVSRMILVEDFTTLAYSVFLMGSSTGWHGRWRSSRRPRRRRAANLDDLDARRRRQGEGVRAGALVQRSLLELDLDPLVER